MKAASMRYTLRIMIFRRFLVLPLLATLMTPSSTRAQNVAADGANQTFDYLSGQYFENILFKFAPTEGTAAGLHQYDAQLEDYSAANTKREIAALHDFEKKLSAIDPRSLDAQPAADYEILLNNIRGQLLQLEVIRGWEKNPDLYSSGITNAIFVIMERPYASVDVRLRAAIEREKQIPEALAYARANLKNPPHIYTEIALEQIDGDISFFQNDVPSAFASATGAQTKADFAKSNAAVIDALKSYAAWMKSDLLPRSNGDFRYGADTFSKALNDSEMVDIPLDRLLQIGYDDLHKNQAEFARVAKEIDPSKTPQQELAELAAMHPAPDKLLEAFHDRFNSEVGFIRTHHIITIPSDVQPTLEETPPFMRATTQASMGHSRPVRDQLQQGLLQRDVARPKLVRAANVGIHGRLQHGHHRLDQRARGLSRDTTFSSFGRRRFRRPFARCSARTRTSKAGPTTASR